LGAGASKKPVKFRALEVAEADPANGVKYFDAIQHDL
jgi:hypothetical protein